MGNWTYIKFLDPCLPLLEAITVYKIENGNVFKQIKYLTSGGYNSVFNVTTQDDRNLILKVQFVDDATPASYHVLERIMNDANMNCPNFPKIYFGSWKLSHNVSAGRIDCSWVIMEKYQDVDEEILKNNMNEMEKITLAMLRIACELYKHNLVFNDWKCNNMLFDSILNDYVLGDTDFVIIDPNDVDHVYFTDSPFIPNIHDFITERSLFITGKCTLREQYRGKINSFDVMIWTIRLCIQKFITRKNIPDKLQRFVDLVPLESNELGTIDISEIEQIIS